MLSFEKIPEVLSSDSICTLEFLNIREALEATSRLPDSASRASKWASCHICKLTKLASEQGEPAAFSLLLCASSYDPCHRKTNLSAWPPVFIHSVYCFSWHWIYSRFGIMIWSNFINLLIGKNQFGGFHWVLRTTITFAYFEHLQQTWKEFKFCTICSWFWRRYNQPSFIQELWRVQVWTPAS